MHPCRGKAQTSLGTGCGGLRETDAATRLEVHGIPQTLAPPVFATKLALYTIARATGRLSLDEVSAPASELRLAPPCLCTGLSCITGISLSPRYRASEGLAPLLPHRGLELVCRAVLLCRIGRSFAVVVSFLVPVVLCC